MAVARIFEKLWQNYSKLTPSADRIHKLLKDHGENNIVNDHIALRTCDLPGFGIKDLAVVFEDLGYKKIENYRFEAKKLNALHLEVEGNTSPKVFISELCTDEMDSDIKDIFTDIFTENLTQIFDASINPLESRVLCGAPWDKDYEVYKSLAARSEYASWLYAWGLIANHFTVSVNHLTKFEDLKALNDFLLANNFKLNDAGGLIKGGAECFLAQSSTMADTAKVEFKQGVYDVPCCFYEFAQRFEIPGKDGGEGQLYHGFVTDNADKIFESTFNR